ncbi:MAG: hemolysin III family protein [Gemmatimonadota bacterium]|nr:hemolysin III family protein [Gemmatimonadota bacterium]
MRRDELRQAKERLFAVGGWGDRTFEDLPDVCHQQELANSVTGAIGLLGSLIAFAMLIDLGTQLGSTAALVSGTIYGLTLVLSYTATTVYHSLRCEVRKARWRVADHCAVYLLIAGSYTPLAIGLVGGKPGWLLFAAVWALALLGIAFKLKFRFRYPGTSVAIYLVMGWLGVFLVKTVIDSAGFEAFLLIAAGGLSFTIGTLFFGAKRFKYHHAMWHVMVIAGCALHYLAIVGHILPPVT